MLKEGKKILMRKEDIFMTKQRHEFGIQYKTRQNPLLWQDHAV